MNSGNGQRRSRRLRLGRAPDPASAHGARIDLILSVVAGTPTASGRGFALAWMVRVGFAGAFLFTSPLALVGNRSMAGRLIAGLLLAFARPGAALYLGVSPSV
jgi:hypothetical protein